MGLTAEGKERPGPGAASASEAGAVPHNRLTHGPEEIEAVSAVVRSGYWAAGPRTQELECRLAARAGVCEAVCVSSGSAALRLALRSLGVGRGDVVVVPAYSCVALADACMACGATPLAVDVSPEDWNLAPAAAAAAAAEYHPRAVVAVHTFGAPADMMALRRCGVPVVEDCAHAFGIAVEGAPLGGHGDRAVLSFYATKLLGAGEGGAVLTDDGAAAAFVREWRDYTDRPAGAGRGNDKMTDLEAALALCQLDRLGAMLDARRLRAQLYHDLLARAASRTNRFRLPSAAGPRVWYRYAVELLDGTAAEVVAGMARRGVSAAEPVTDWRPAAAPPCPVANRAYRSLVSLPLYPTLTEGEQARAAQAFLAACGIGG